MPCIESHHDEQVNCDTPENKWIYKYINDEENEVEKHGEGNVSFSTHVCGDFVEFGDEGVLNDVHDDFGDDDHDDVGQQRPHVVWRDERRKE